MVGDLTFSGGLHVEGSIDGTITAVDGDAVVVISGSVRGKIKVPRVVVGGRVDGDIHASEQLHLKSGASVTGSVVCRTVDMQLNATLDGELTVDPKLSSPAANKKAS